MNPNDVAPLVLGVIFIVTVGGVILLRPLMKKLGDFLEVLAAERRASLSEKPVDRVEAARIVTLLEQVDQRLSHLEDRAEFTDKLLAERPRNTLRLTDPQQ